jgi:glycosyltransferase involved in cell wall biosynthesis
VKIFLSFICPGYNEEKNLNSLINTIKFISQKLKVRTELIYIDDNSSDNTKKIIKNFKLKNLKYIKNKTNLGFGGSVAVGLKIAKGNKVMMIPSECDYTKKSLASFAKSGFKNSAQIATYKNPNLRHPLRRLITFFITKFTNLIFSQNIKIYTSLFIYDKKILKNLNLKSKKFAFQMELIIKLLKSKRINKIEYKKITIDNNDRNFFTGAMKVEAAIDLLKTYIELIKFKKIN